MLQNLILAIWLIHKNEKYKINIIKTYSKKDSHGFHPNHEVRPLGGLWDNFPSPCSNLGLCWIFFRCCSWICKSSSISVICFLMLYMTRHDALERY